MFEDAREARALLNHMVSCEASFSVQLFYYKAYFPVNRVAKAASSSRIEGCNLMKYVSFSLWHFVATWQTFGPF